jgi:hypothetical protein
MRKIRLYLDTSVISDIASDINRERETTTRKFFQFVTEHSEEFELLISPMVLQELELAPEPKRLRFASFLKLLPCIVLQESDEAENLAWLYVVEDVLSDNHINDLTHIAYAVIARCDYIISWNFKHFVNVKTISRVNAVNAVNQYPNIVIITPEAIIGEMNDEYN